LAGGWMTAAAGLLLHYLVAYSFTALFFVLYPRVKTLARQPVVTAIVYGAFAWTVMNLAVVPLSRIGKFPATFKGAAINLAILMICIGLPNAFLARRHYAKK
jgi:hypothetical protein